MPGEPGPFDPKPWKQCRPNVQPERARHDGEKIDQVFGSFFTGYKGVYRLGLRNRSNRCGVFFGW